MSPWEGRGSRKGMTLIEVLLALAILGVGLSVLVASAGRAMSVVKAVRHYATARHLLDIVDLEQPIVDPSALAGMTESGGFDPPNHAYLWERSVEPMMDLEETETDYYIVSTRILWSDYGRDSQEERVTGLYAMSEMEGVLPGMEEIDTDADSADGGVRATGEGIRAGAPSGRGGDMRRTGVGPDIFGGGMPGGMQGGAQGGMRGGMPGMGGQGAPGRGRGRQNTGAAAIRGDQGGGFPSQGSIRSGAGRAFALPGQGPGGGSVGYTGPVPQDDRRGGPPVPGR